MNLCECWETRTNKLRRVTRRARPSANSRIHFRKDGKNQRHHAKADDDYERNTQRFSNASWSSQDLEDTLSPRLVSRFELLWTDTAQMTVAARSIVDSIDVIGHLG